MVRLLILLFAPLPIFATEGRPWDWPTKDFQAVLYIGGDIVPGTIVTQGWKLCLIPWLAQFQEDKKAAYDLRYTIIVSREGDTVFREVNRQLKGVRYSKHPNRHGALGPVVVWEVPTSATPGIYRVTIMARDVLGAKFAHRSYNVTVKKG